MHEIAVSVTSYLQRPAVVRRWVTRFSCHVLLGGPKGTAGGCCAHHHTTRAIAVPPRLSWRDPAFRVGGTLQACSRCSSMIWLVKDATTAARWPRAIMRVTSAAVDM